MREYRQTPLLKTTTRGYNRDFSCTTLKPLDLFYSSVPIFLRLWALLLRAHTLHIYSEDYPWATVLFYPYCPHLPEPVVLGKLCLSGAAYSQWLTFAEVGKLSFLTLRWDKIWAVFYAPEFPEKSSWVWHFTKKFPPAQLLSLLYPASPTLLQVSPYTQKITYTQILVTGIHIGGRCLLFEKRHPD